MQRNNPKLRLPALARPLWLRLDMCGLGGSVHAYFENRGARRHIRLERAADQCRDSRLQQRDQ
jgi:hypothetical protein